MFSSFSSFPRLLLSSFRLKLPVFEFMRLKFIDMNVVQWPETDSFSAFRLKWTIFCFFTTEVIIHIQSVLNIYHRLNHTFTSRTSFPKECDRIWLMWWWKWANDDIRFGRGGEHLQHWVWYDVISWITACFSNRLAYPGSVTTADLKEENKDISKENHQTSGCAF